MEENPPKDPDGGVYKKIFETKKEKQSDTVEHVEAARREAAASFWGWVGRIIPFALSSAGVVIAVILIIILICFLALFLAYIIYLLGWIELSRMEEIKSLLEKVYSFVDSFVVGGVTTLLFYRNFLNRKQP